MAEHSAEKYHNWLVSLESDSFTMYIKTWFAFLSSIHELILSHATPERREELMNSRGDGAFLEEYKRQYLPAIALPQTLKFNIKTLYEKSKIIIRKDYPEFYFTTFFKKIIEKPRFYNKQEVRVAYCSACVDVSIQKDLLFLGFRFAERPADFRKTFGEYLKCGFAHLHTESLDAADHESSFYTQLATALKSRFATQAKQRLNEKRETALSQFISQLLNSLREDKVYREIYREWIDESSGTFDNDMRMWFYDFCYSLRNVMFHRVVDPFDERWSEVIKLAFQGLRELLLENIKLINQAQSNAS